MARQRRARAAVALVCVAISAAVACGGSEGGSATTPRDTIAAGDQATTPAEGETTTTTFESSSPAHPVAGTDSADASAPGEADDALRDGRHFGYIRDASESPRVVVFDLAQWFDGEDASRAAAEDGHEEDVESYIRNVNPRLRRLDVAEDVRVTRVSCSDGCRDRAPGDYPSLAASFRDGHATSMDGDYRGASTQYWLTVRRGVVVIIDEQYLP